MKGLGYKKLITTPHIMTDMYKNTNENIMSGLEKVKQELIKEKITYDLEAAAEYYIDYDFERKIDKENFLTFGDNYILTELSFMDPPIKLFDIIFNPFLPFDLKESFFSCLIRQLCNCGKLLAFKYKK